MASTPPSTITLNTPPTPRHAGEASRHYGTRQSTRYTSHRLRAARTPPPPHPTSHTSDIQASHSKSLRPRQPASPSSSSASPRSLSSSAHTSPYKQSTSRNKPANRTTMDDDDRSTKNVQQIDAANHNGGHPSKAMLPTPASLPRKKDVPQREVQAAARVLFPSKPDQVDDAMPTPRKNRKGRKSVGFSLYSSMDEETNDHASNVHIYTDSRDKVPELVPHEDNPFLEHPQNPPRAEQPVSYSRSKKRKHTREVHTNPHIEKAFNHDKGIVYVFRGKKIYKPFPQDSDSDREESPTANGTETGVMDDVELSRLRPLTRSSLKPKLLFPNPKKQEDRTAATLAEEEALTEVEDHAKFNSKQTVTPTKPSFGPASPPTTGRATRSKPQASRVNQQTDREMSDVAQPKSMGKKKVSPFDSWQRTKPGRTISRGKKRDAEEMEMDGAEDGKRLRSNDTGPSP